MKTSVINVHNMLSVLSVDEVEKRVRDVPGVGSATVNHAAGSATVRYDETRLKIADRWAPCQAPWCCAAIDPQATVRSVAIGAPWSGKMREQVEPESIRPQLP